MKHTTWGWKSFDNSELFAQRWTPEGSIKANIILIHGLGEHSSRYDHLAEYYTEKGFQVLAYDQQGHGKSETKKGYIPTKDTFLRDIDLFISAHTKLFEGKPIILYGHSMGGMTVLEFLETHQNTVLGTIATAPLIDEYSPTSPFLKTLSRILDKIFPSILLDTNLEVEFLSKDKTVVENYKKDPLVHGKASARLANYLLNTGDQIMQNYDKVKIPLLMMVGSQEKIVSKEMIELFAQKTPTTTLKVWDDLYHELHNEPEKQKVFDFTINWIEDLLSKN